MMSRRILMLASISAFIAVFAQNLYTPILPQIQQQLQTSHYLVNLSVSLYTVALAVMQIVYGPLADAKGRRTVILPAIVVYTGASFGCAYAGSIEMLLLCRFFQGIGAAAIPVVAAAVIGDLYEGRERARGMATYQLFLTLALSMGPLVGGMVGGWSGYSGIFLLVTVMGIAMLLANLFWLPETKPAAGTASPFRLSSLVFIAVKHRSSATVLIGFTQYLAVYVFTVFLPQIAAHRYGLGPEQTGGLFLLLSLLPAVSVRLGVRLQSRMGNERSLLFTNMLNVLSIFLFAFTANLSLPLLIAGLCLFGFTMGLTMPVPATLLTEYFPKDRATAVGVYNLVRYIGMAAGPIIGVPLYLGGNVPLLFGAIAAIYGVSVWLGMLIIRRRTSAPGVRNREHGL